MALGLLWYAGLRVVVQQASIIRDRSLDDECGAERFAVFFEGSPVASANTATAPLCRTPCVNPVDVRSCTALNNKTFAVNTIVGCYCKTALQRAMSGACSVVPCPVARLPRDS